MATGAALALAGCMVPPIEPGSPVVRDYRAEKINEVPPLPDYRSDYLPAAGSGWTSGWNRTSPQRTETARDYYLIDAADGLAQAIGDAPPDFAFRFDGRDAWIWQSNEGEVMIVEPSPYGVIQYYYAPRAAAPYLVRDVYQSYAYEGPDFVASYGQDGRLDQRVPSPRTLDSADRLQARGRAIMAASYQRRWDDNVAASWSVQTFSGFGFGDSYGSGVGRGWSGGWQPRWREHRDWGLERELRRERDARRRLEEEARDRADNAERFRQWRREGRRGSAPTMRRGGRGGNPGGDSFVQPVSPPVLQPEAGAGPIMTPGGGGTGRPRPGSDRPRSGMVPPVTAQPVPPTAQPAPVPAGPEAPRVIRRPRPEPGVQTQPSEISETPLLVPANDDLLREQRDAEAARAGQIAIEAERGRERTIHLEAERMAREEEARERAERDAVAAASAAAASNAIAAEQARQREDAERQRAMVAAQEAVAAAASEARSREAEQAQADAHERAAAQAEAEARERAEVRAAAQAEAAAARAAAAAEAAAQAASEAAEERQQARQSNAEEGENVRPD